MMVGADELRQVLELQNYQLCIAWWLLLGALGSVGGGGGGGKATAAQGAEVAATQSTAQAAATQLPASVEVPVETPVPPAVQAMLKPEVEPQVSQMPVVDFGANLSTPSGPARVTESFPTTPRTSSAPPDKSLVQRLDAGVKKISASLDEFKETEVGELVSNVQELQERLPQASRPSRGASSASPEQAVASLALSPVPQLSRAETTSFPRGGGDLNLAGRGGGSLATSRPEAIEELIAELRLNRRSFG